MLEKFRKSLLPLELDQDLLIGRGGVRAVYHHPLDSDKCIKILFNRDKRRAVSREERYLHKYWQMGKPFDHLSRFFGHCRTTLGWGGVFQLVRDYDGSVSSPLPTFLPGRPLADRLSPARISTMLRKLHDHLLTHAIIVSDPAPGNIVVRYVTPDQPTLVLVDGIGNPHFIKIADYQRYKAQKIIKKKWKYYIEDNPLLIEILSCERCITKVE